MKKQLLYILLAFVPMVANAYVAEIGGIYYNFSGDEAIVTYQESTFRGYSSNYSGAVVIPTTVTYSGKTYNVTRIDVSAFNDCNELTSVTIPDGVVSIGDYAFADCSSLTSFTIPNSVTYIGDYAFYGCYFATSSFVNNSSLVSYNNWRATLCDEETSDGLLIKDNIVVKCRPWATVVTIPEGVTSIGGYAFSGCSGLTSVTIPEGVTSIGSNAFVGCSGLTTITIPNSVTSIAYIAFSGCYFVSGSFVNNSSLTFDTNWGATLCDEETSDGLLIKDNIIVRCRPWTTVVTIPEGVTVIGFYAFQDCSGLTSVTIPNSVISISDYAFSGCSGLTYVTIPNSVIYIGYYAFSWCSGLTDVFCYAENIPETNSNAFGTYISSVTLHVPASALEAYKTTSPWSSFGSIIPLEGTGDETYIDGIYYNFSDSFAEVTKGENAYSGDLVIPASVSYKGKSYNVTSIGDYAFSGCSGLTSVTIPNSVTCIGNGAFEDCRLRNVLLKSIIPPAIIEDVFSKNIYNHTILYIPNGSWSEYVFNSNWYQFINIRETAMEEEQLSMQQAYTLMDAGTFTYSVYDPVNNCIGTINSVGINEDNPNHSWQVIEADGSHYLYNVGAKKFVVASINGYTLSESPIPIEIVNGDNGIIIGSQSDKQWALVTNERLNAEQVIIDGIDDIPTSMQPGASYYYDLLGRKLSDKPERGIYIENGKKVLLK